MVYATIGRLVDYASVLSKSAEETTRAEDRSVYTQHLAAAAKMFIAAHLGRAADLKALVASERRSYGWGYLSGEPGSAAERAFDAFASAIESGDEA
jgi:hypothetical protein